MKSIAEIFDNSKELLDSISNFMDKYIGSSLLRKCGITKIVDSVTEKSVYEYADNPISRLIGTTVKESKFLEKCVSAGQLLTDKILAGFTAASPYRMFETGNFFRDYKKDTFYRFDLMPKANWERLQQETAAGVIRDLESQTDKNINAPSYLMIPCTPVPVERAQTCAEKCLTTMTTGYAPDTG